ncbi:DUF21-domain-containing protein [Trametopsis cervina]|nr:DUF21-domain-containing protein [Trametopsis cervina]
MVPTPIYLRSRSPGLLYSLASLIVHHVPKLVSRALYGETATVTATNTFAKRGEKHDTKFIVFACLIPILVLASGLFAGLTLGYMSLDETQLHVLSISGTPKQKEYARKIEPIRKNGHLLLITLILANMIVNETLPVISDPVLGGGAQSVVVSTVLIVIFSEIIPQSLCTRYGLAIGANMAWLVRILILCMGVVSWPVAKLLEWLLGSHHGIMYRRAELKELIAMHANTGLLGGDLKSDTVTIIGATLDLQEKVVRQAMTPIDKVFMLNINCNLDTETMRKISDTGHSRVPVYEEVDVAVLNDDGDSTTKGGEMVKAKKIVGLLLVKQCLMLDPKEATPLRTLQLHRHVSVPNNMSLLHILDRFQEGRSHMAIVSRFSEEKAMSVKQEVKKGLTQRLMARVGMGDSDSDSDSETDSEVDVDGGSGAESAQGSEKKKNKWRNSFKKKKNPAADIEKGEEAHETSVDAKETSGTLAREPTLPQSTWARLLAGGREQAMPDDAVLAKEDAKDLLRGFDANVAPVGIITLEDVLEELIGEEIYDEFDAEGQSNLKAYVAPKSLKARGRDRERHKFGVVPSEDSTAVNDRSAPSSVPPSQAPSQAPSPKLINVPVPVDRPISRTNSIGQTMTNLLQIRRDPTRRAASVPRGTGLGSHRRANSQPDLVGTSLMPSAGIASTDRVSDVHEHEDEDALGIPGLQLRTGPDIASKGKGTSNE